MPRLKQPVPLQQLAFYSLVAHVVHCCDELSDLTRLRQRVVDIRQLVYNYVPDILFVQICEEFLHNFWEIGYERSKNRPDGHNRAVLEIMMDVKVVGLTCRGDILHYMDPSDVHRLQGLKILDWRQLQHFEVVPRGLENFHLQDLTTFIFPRICTDLDLEIIGQRCLKLQVLRIPGSKKVTDRGLRALSLCADLRVLNVHYCPVSDKGINELLSVHTKIEQFNVGDFYTCGEISWNILSRSTSLVCPSVKQFAMKSNPVENEHLESVVALFPNLTSLRVCCPLTGSLAILRDLKNLTVLKFAYSSGSFSVENLKKLLATVGANIIVLTMHLCNPNVGVTQNDVDYIFQVCSNLEYLGFDYKSYDKSEILVIPPFKKLKNLKCVALTDFNDCNVRLEFGIMSVLESLTAQGFHEIFHTTESIMLDNVKFPNLREVRTFYNTNEHTDRINRIAKERNLDFALIFQQLA